MLCFYPKCFSVFYLSVHSHVPPLMTGHWPPHQHTGVQFYAQGQNDKTNIVAAKDHLFSCHCEHSLYFWFHPPGKPHQQKHTCCFSMNWLESDQFVFLLLVSNGRLTSEVLLRSSKRENKLSDGYNWKILLMSVTFTWKPVKRVDGNVISGKWSTAVKINAFHFHKLLTCCFSWDWRHWHFCPPAFSRTFHQSRSCIHSTTLRSFWESNSLEIDQVTAPVDQSQRWSWKSRRWINHKG